MCSLKCYFFRLFAGLTYAHRSKRRRSRGSSSATVGRLRTAEAALWRRRFCVAAPGQLTKAPDPIHFESVDNITPMPYVPWRLRGDPPLSAVIGTETPLLVCLLQAHVQRFNLSFPKSRAERLDRRLCTDPSGRNEIAFLVHLFWCRSNPGFSARE